MNEKRFKLDWSKRVGIHFVLDTNTDERIDFYSDVVDKLNELQATIEAKNKYQRTLEAKIRRLKDRINVLEKKMSEKRFILDKISHEDAGLSVQITDKDKDHNYFINTKVIYEEDIDEMTDLLNEFNEENTQLKKLLQEAEDEIDKLKKLNQLLMESFVNKESENENNQETEVRECQFCGEFRTEYHEWDCNGTWTSEDYCNAGHDIEDTNPNKCKDYWDPDE